MVSRWYYLKEKALKLRRGGLSIRNVEIQLGIPRSTLSGWFKDIELSTKQKKGLYLEWRGALVKARVKAALWHTKQKEIRLEEARIQAENVLKNIDTSKNEIIDLVLAALYLGEGFKTTDTGMGNSDPLVLKFFITALQNNYDLPLSKIKCELHLRADQNPVSIKKYWAKELGIPLSNFTTTSIDKRTVGRPTFPNYKGVCAVRCGHIAIQRKLLHLIKTFCKKVITEGRVAQLVRATD